MATITPTIGLILPDENDYVNVNQHISGNFQKIDETFGKILHEATLTGTTSSTGNIKAFDDTDHYIVAAKSNNYIILWYQYNNNSTYLKVLDRQSLTAVASTNVTIKYWYFDTLEA